MTLVIFVGSWLVACHVQSADGDLVHGSTVDLILSPTSRVGANDDFELAVKATFAPADARRSWPVVRYTPHDLSERVAPLTADANEKVSPRPDEVALICDRVEPGVGVVFEGSVQRDRNARVVVEKVGAPSYFAVHRPPGLMPGRYRFSVALIRDDRVASRTSNTVDIQIGMTKTEWKDIQARGRPQAATAPATQPVSTTGPAVVY